MTVAYEQAAKWLNDNQGVVDIIIFLLVLAFGWASGIFSALRRRPRFKLLCLDGPTFCCTYAIGKKHGEFECHRTAIALYLEVENVGAAASSIKSISVGYRWHISPFCAHWIRHLFGWFWLESQATALADFQAMIGENIKVFPFLMQKNFLTAGESRTYLEVGRSTNGVVYFEQPDSWGGCFPTVRDGRAPIIVRVCDVFGNKHTAKFFIPAVSLEEARKYNPSFGKTLAELRGETLPFDTR